MRSNKVDMGKKHRLGCAGAIILVIVLFLAYMIYSAETESQMPKVTGKPAPEAVKMLKDEEFTNIKVVDKAGNDHSKDDFMIVDKQSVKAEEFYDKDDEIKLTVLNKEAYDTKQKQKKMDKALEKKLPAEDAWHALDLYGDTECPYGFKVHWVDNQYIIQGAIDENTWQLKAFCTVKNAFGQEADMTCEAKVSGTKDSPVVSDFKIY